MESKMKTMLTAMAALVATMCAQADTWTDPATGYTWTYEVDGDTAKMVTYGDYGWGGVAISPKPTGALTIPAQFGGKTVTRIEDYAFADCSGLTSVTIPDSVIIIGKDAFSGCSALKSFVVDEHNPSYKSVNGLLLSKDGKELILGVNGDVVIPDGVTSIGKHTFCYYCSKGIYYDDSPQIVVVGGAFSGCSGLTSVTIPASVVNIGDYAFSNCSGLKSFAVDEANPNYRSVNGLLLSKDGKELIQGVNGNVTVPDGVTSIRGEAFLNCSGLTNVTIPDSVTSIGYLAFDGTPFYNNRPDGLVVFGRIVYGMKGTCPATVEIPEGVTSIGNGAFSACFDLTNVTIPDSVTNIAANAFDGTPFYYNQPDGLVVFGKVVYGYSGVCPASVTIPDGVTSIGSHAFENCSGLTSVTIPDSVTSIGWGAFWGCSGLTSVAIPDGVASIAGSAFSGCSGLKSVTIPDGVTSIGERAFYGCSGLTSVTIPASVTSIGSGAFWDCSGLTSFVVDENNQNYKSVNGMLLSKDGKELIQGVNGNVAIPDGVTSIGDSAFEACSGLTSVTIPASVTSIGDSAFFDCSGLTSVTIPDSVTSIGADAFAETPFYDNQPDGLVVFGRVVYGMNGTCPATVEIPDGVTSIGDWAFYGCYDLMSVTIPDSVTSIGASAFSDCYSLMNVTIPDSVTSIGERAFATGAVSSEFYYRGNLAVVHVSSGEVERVKALMVGSGFDVGNVKFIEDGMFAVVFSPNGGSVEEVMRVVADGSTVGKLPVPLLEGYTFAGWWTAASDGDEITAETVVTGDVTYYAHWTTPDLPDTAGELDTSFAKAQTVLGALYGRDGVPVGTVQVKAGKINKKKGTVKISASATLLVDGKAKKITAKAVEVAATSAAAPVNVVFKAPIGEMSFEMAADGTFRLKNDSYVMAEKQVGGNWTREDARVYVTVTSATLPQGTIEELLPDGEPVIPKAGKWSFAKAAGVKYAKDKKTKEASLVVDTKKGANHSGMKLSYTPKTGIFKGSFKIYAIQDGKLKKFTVKVIGVVVDGKGYGNATGPSGLRFAVTVE